VSGSPALTVVAVVERNGFHEGSHTGSVIGLASDGSVAVSAGTPDSPMLPRSCLKPLQAVGMLRAGLVVDDDELAIICASHNGEPRHVDVVRRLLARADLDEAVLDNDASWPQDSQTRRELTVAGGRPARITQNCSGKHAGMLATCVAAGWPTAGYRDPAHPLQEVLRGATEDLTGDRVSATVVDGCGAPMFAVSLTGLARAFARLALGAPGSDERRCFDVMRANPGLIGGRKRDVTTLIEGVPDLVAKDGAEGVYAAVHADGRAVAVKIDDGASRARVPVLVAALRALGVDAPVFAELEITAVLGHGDPVGAVRAVI
jgi:L-asparaginase II